MHVLFVTTELAPFTHGGAGVLVARVSKLLKAGGHSVSVILIADGVPEPDPGMTVVGSSPDAVVRSFTAADAVGEFVADNDVDLIEIQDFDGLGFWTLADRGRAGVEHVPIQIRFHGTADLMFDAVGVEPPELRIMRSLEVGVLSMADRVVVPSAAIGELVIERYAIEPDRTSVGTPPVPDTNRAWTPGPDPVFVAAGRLGEVKGTHDLIAAATPVLRTHPSARLILVGEDGWSASQHRPMSEWLTDALIAGDIASRISLAGRLNGEDFTEAMASAWAVVVPSRFESFHLGMHEARRLGVPVIVPALPAFEGTIDASTGGLVYDGTIDGLTQAMNRIVGDVALRDRLAEAPAPPLGDPLAPYTEKPKPRHPRAQAGLGTIAVKEYEAIASRTGTPAVPLRSTVLTRFVTATARILPDPIVSAAAKVLPAGWVQSSPLFARLQHARWTDLAATQEADTIRPVHEIWARVDAGEFPDVADPLVSVVIPVYNDGEFLEEAIASVFGQTEQSFEIVVVNDGSTDRSTLTIIENLAWPRTTVVNQPNRGLAAARNAGVAVSRGRFIVPLDADDAIEPRFIEVQLGALEANPTAAYATTWTRLTGDVEEIWIPRRFNKYQILLSNSNVGCVLLRREAFDAVGGYNETMRSGNEDWDLWVRLMDAGYDMVEVPEVLFRYRKHGITMSVRTEARYETARLEMVQSNPALFAPAAIRDRKRQHYPALSIVVPDVDLVPNLIGQTIEDAEVLVVGSIERDLAWPASSFPTLDDAIGAAKGKFVTIWNPLTEPDTNLLGDMTRMLERSSNAGVVTTSSETPLSVVRTWSLFDPAGPAEVIKFDSDTGAEAALHAGDRPDDRWQVPTEIGGLPVHRQRPEEEGFLPDWIVTGALP
ncbi:MAG: glycosyltransferase [Acidimicrobiia bacterium]|nr:glycosyltransferase [Acidimicrobiia bacterium]